MHFGQDFNSAIIAASCEISSSEASTNTGDPRDSCAETGMLGSDEEVVESRGCKSSFSACTSKALKPGVGSELRRRRQPASTVDARTKLKDCELASAAIVLIKNCVPELVVKDAKSLLNSA